MRIRFALVAVLLIASCGQPATTSEAPPPAPPAEESSAAPQPTDLPTPDAALVAAPSSAFTAVEPSELGVQPATSVREALAPLLSSDVNEGATLQLGINQSGDAAVADIVRSGLEDDSVSAAQLRVEFRHEPDGWYPTNAYRRTMCARGDNAGQWSAAPCP